MVDHHWRHRKNNNKIKKKRVDTDTKSTLQSCDFQLCYIRFLFPCCILFTRIKIKVAFNFIVFYLILIHKITVRKRTQHCVATSFKNVVEKETKPLSNYIKAFFFSLLQWYPLSTLSIKFVIRFFFLINK